MKYSDIIRSAKFIPDKVKVSTLENYSLQIESYTVTDIKGTYQMFTSSNNICAYFCNLYANETLYLVSCTINDKPYFLIKWDLLYIDLRAVLAEMNQWVSVLDDLNSYNADTQINIVDEYLSTSDLYKKSFGDITYSNLVRSDIKTPLLGVKSALIDSPAKIKDSFNRVVDYFKTKYNSKPVIES